MSTRSTTHFQRDGITEAIVYRHSDGYPDGHGTDLLNFFKLLKKTLPDNRFNDPSYLAAKVVVWLSEQFNIDYITDKPKANRYDFLSVGVVMEDPGDIEYRYEVNCSEMKNDMPQVKCFSISQNKYVHIPTKVKV